MVNPPALPATLSRPDAQAIVDALNLRLATVEEKFPVTDADLAAGNRNYGIVTSLPTSPTPASGDRCIYSTGGVMWELVFQSSDSYWYKVGGAPLFAEVAADESTSSTTYTATGFTALAITLPLAGDYDVTVAADITYNANAGFFMSYDIGGTGAVDADAAESNPGGVSAPPAGPFTRRKTGLTAVTLTAKYKVASGTGHFKKRWMSVNPVRVK